jgi:predicted TIM-barrel fold metal-dependent hydrolase
MVYFPEHRLLYASDTPAINDDGSLYDPELMREVMEAVKREGLEVDTFFAIHQGPMPWQTVVALVEKAVEAGAAASFLRSVHTGCGRPRCRWCL